MALRPVITSLALATLLAAPAGAEQRERRRPESTRADAEQSAPAAEPREQAVPRERAVPRAEARRNNQARAAEPARENDSRRSDANSRSYDNSRGDDNRRSYDNSRNYDNGGRYDDNRGYGSRNDHRNDHRGYGYGSRRYDAHYRNYYYFTSPRIIRPTIVRVAPYRPYVYRPSFSVGVYYGSGGYYPYGYTPRAYYEPIPGRPYGGLRITGAPRDARVFADGYFVGIVNDFDGIFQHLNLEAGAHRIEIAWDGYQPLAFDVFVQPGETTTFRADGYFRY